MGRPENEGMGDGATPQTGPELYSGNRWELIAPLSKLRT